MMSSLGPNYGALIKAMLSCFDLFSTIVKIYSLGYLFANNW